MRGLPVFFTALAEEDLDQIEDYISGHRKHAQYKNGFRITLAKKPSEQVP